MLTPSKSFSKQYLFALIMPAFIISIGFYGITEAADGSTSNTFYTLVTLAFLFAIGLSFFIVRDVRALIKALEATNRKAATSETKCRAFIECAGDAIFILNAQTIITDVNNAACILLAYPREELIGMKISQIVQPEELEKQARYLADVQTNTAALSDRKFRRKDGSTIEAEVNTRKLEDAGYISIIRDVNERKQIEEKLRQSGERYKSIITVSNTGAWEFHGDTGYLWCSPEYFSMLGRNERDYDLSGKSNLKETWLDLLHPDDKEKSRQHFADYLKNGSQGTYESYFRLRHADGHWVWMWSRGQTLRDTNGNLTDTTVGTHIDITESTRATELFRHQFENSPDLIVIVNKDLKIDAINRAHPYTAEEIIGKDSIDVLPKESRQLARENILKCFETNQKVEFENMLFDKRWVQSRIVPIIINKEVNQVMIFATDITERKKAEKERQEIQEQAMAMLEEKVAERTHELYETNRLLNLRNLEITDSINYAQNIQRAILSQSTDYYKIFPDSFVLWWPKDAVSGDFYWCYSNDRYDFIAVVDCTGHGVPGALMSIIASQTLDRIVNAYGYTEPKEILLRLDEDIVRTLKQETSHLEDGMDIVLCRVDKQNKILSFADAQRPLFYYNGTTVNEIPGNKFGVGGFLRDNYLKTFSQTEIHYQEGDCIYLTSDGYYSQFGGTEGKKLMKKRFHNYLSEISCNSMMEQKLLLHQYYNEWRGNEEQVDDVLVIGVKL